MIKKLLEIPDGTLLEWCSLCNHAILVCPREECDWCSCNGAATCETCEPLRDIIRQLEQRGKLYTRDEVEAQPGYVAPEDQEPNQQWIDLFGKRGMSGELNFDFYQWKEKVYRLRAYFKKGMSTEIYKGNAHWYKIGFNLSGNIMDYGTKLETANEIEAALDKYDLERPRLVYPDKT